MPIDAGDGQVGHDRPRCPQQAGEQLDEVVPLLAGGPQHPCQDLPGVGSGRCGCRPHLAAHDRGSDGLVQLASWRPALVTAWTTPPRAADR
jgi:hypothetical protein